MAFKSSGFFTLYIDILKTKYTDAHYTTFSAYFYLLINVNFSLFSLVLWLKHFSKLYIV